MRYYFHTVEDGELTRDEVGFEYPDDAAAKDQATHFLADVASDMIPEDGQRRFGVKVTNEAGDLIASVGFAIEEGPQVGSSKGQRQT